MNLEIARRDPSPRPAPSWTVKGDRRVLGEDLVISELLGLVSTRRDVWLVVLALLTTVLGTLVFATGSDRMGNVDEQTVPLLFAIQLSQVLVHVLVIRMVCASWHGPGRWIGLVAQPARRRTLYAQAAVLGLIVLTVTIVQLGVYFPFARAHALAMGEPFLLAGHFWGLLAIQLIGTLMLVAASAAIALLAVNVRGALALYLCSVPVLLFARQAIGSLIGWFDPFQPAAALAGTGPGAFTAIVSVLLWAGLVTYGVRRVLTRDIDS
ncbi:hypothetical protein D5S17_29265 [Pseudonocardiaceae bacterium YIM PH 21723]|nr:hypothetical protein D5S17_29265 [Pseudonocardiaceae bacterium YIM PH 21723]